jgi:bifunctional non-homologous end joining protein LigD
MSPCILRWIGPDDTFRPVTARGGVSDRRYPLAMAAPLRPMKAAAATELPTDGRRWAYEVKWDGMRVLTELQEGRVAAWSANGADATARFPELQALGDALADHERIVLDGEVVALDPGTGRPDFGRLQPRMQAASPAAVARTAAETPVSYVLFDILDLDGRSLLDAPYDERRALLEATVPAGPGWFVAGTQADGRALLDAVEAQGLEGVVAKRRDSRYEPGRRSTAWVKVKVRRHQELVVAGWLPGTGARGATFGSLLVGWYDPPADGATPAGPLRYAGRVGTGFRDPLLRSLRSRLDALTVPDCPFDPPPPREVTRVAHWVSPEIVVEVAHAEWTAEGVLRHPSYLGERVDKAPTEVGREP